MTRIVAQRGGALVGWLALAMCLTRANAQCDPQWPNGDGIPGVDGRVNATVLWDPDGPGPATSRIVVAGDFLVAGTVPAFRIAAYDPASGTWSPLGTGTSSYVTALAVLPNGNLVAGGAFHFAGGVAANTLALWNGSSWSPVGTGFGDPNAGSVRAMAVRPNGDLVVGGYLFLPSGSESVARWDGSVWTSLVGPSSMHVEAMTTLANGDVVVGGVFGGVGTTLSPNVILWNGSSWVSMAGGLGHQVDALATLTNGHVVAGGVTYMGSYWANHLAIWNGSSWSTLIGGTFGAVDALTPLANGEFVVGGYFWIAGGLGVNHIARKSSTGWSTLAAGMNNPILALAALPLGEWNAGGTFQSAGGGNAPGIARRVGGAWLPMATGTSAASDDGLVLNAALGGEPRRRPAGPGRQLARRVRCSSGPHALPRPFRTA